MPPTLLVRLVLWLWFGLAFATSYQGGLRRLPLPAIQLAGLAVAGLIIALAARPGLLRSWVVSLDLRALILLHVVRVAGFYLLLLQQAGELPTGFALPAGLGGMLVGLMALPVALAPLAEEARRRAISIWNIAGAADLVLISVSAARLALEDPTSLRALGTLPLSLLPTFIIPLLLAVHGLILLRTRESGNG
jgi:hypothetical protein